MKYALIAAVFCGSNFLPVSASAEPPKSPPPSPGRTQPEWVTEIETAIKAQKDHKQKIYAEFAERWGKAKTDAEQDALAKWEYEAFVELRNAGRTAARSLMPLLREHADDPKAYRGLGSPASTAAATTGKRPAP